MAMKELMQYVIELGFDGKDAERDSKKTFDKIGDNAEDSADQFEGVGGKMGKALVAGFAAVGVGALLMQGINQSMDAKKGVKRLEGQFALSARDAEKYGNLAGDLYADGWGQGLEEVQQVVGLAAQKLSTTTDQELMAISESVLAVSRTWGADFDSVIRSTNQLLQNDLAPNAEAALDLIVAAFQNGGDEAGDLLDTIDEYAQHWEAMGLSGEDALNQIVHGFQNGQRDADKMADAVKEMGIRIREGSEPVLDALEDIGLDAEAVVAAFNEGGPVAREAFLQVVGALDEASEAAGGKEGTQAAVALIGTQFEDLGPKALESLGAVDGALEDTTGKAQELADTVESTEFDKKKRQAEGYLTSIGGLAIDGFNRLNGMFEASENGSLGTAKAFEELGDESRENSHIIEGWVGNIKTAVEESKQLAREAVNSAQGIDSVSEATELVARKTSDAAESLSDYRNETNDAAGALDGAFDSGVDVNKMLADQEDALGDTTDAVEDLTAVFEDLEDQISDRDAWYDVIDAAEDFADKVKDAEAAEKDFGDGSREAAAAWRDADRALGDRVQAVIDYVREADNIPAEKITEVKALLDAGSVDEAEAVLAQLERGRTATITARTIIANAPSSDFGFTPQVSGGNPNSGQTGIGARGGIVTQATRAIIGEAGPEAVIPLDQMPGASPIGGGSVGGGVTFAPGAIQVTSIGSPTPELERLVMRSVENALRRTGRSI